MNKEREGFEMSRFIARHKAEGAEECTYVFNPRNNVTNRAICKRCAHRQEIGVGKIVCTCLIDTNVRRDQHATNSHCETFQEKRVAP